ncbi:halocyanin domain-containing protein [Halosimplex pelagicum]|uniref:Halocyanin domain-containing protein n=2 Tax=Halosimplex pelagicum TaxID=869886 RepID=A0A7D5TJL7_9EURY|nr:halocyanin domain-containing protein [Halosimplex pelagicum]
MATAGVLAGCSTETSGGDGGDGGGGTATDGGDGGSAPSWPSYLDDAQGDTSQDARGQSEVTVAVGPDGSLAYDPVYLRVDSGTTVNFEFESPTHNVKPESQPEGGSLDGTEGSEMEPVDEGETYSVTLETTGIYTYYCGPHETTGMKGGISVE